MIPSELASTTIVFYLGIETKEEALMRLGVTGPVTHGQDDANDFGYIGSMLGLRRRIFLSEMCRGPTPGPPVPPRDYARRRRFFAVARRIIPPHILAIAYKKSEPIQED